MAAILKAMGVKRGDEVLIQAFTCIAVPEAVMSLGAVPRYVDVATGTPNMDADDLADKIGPLTRAVVVQHSFGLPAAVRQLCEVANKRGVPVIEDCAHTIASTVGGRAVGTFGAAAFYSYEASKPVFIGIGGSAVANDDALRARLEAHFSDYVAPPVATQLQLGAMRLAHLVAYRPSTYWTVRSLFRTLVAAGLIRGNYNEMGPGAEPSPEFGHRMGGIQKKLLLAALGNLEKQTAHRVGVATKYATRIRNDDIAHVPVAEDASPVFGRYPLLTENKSKWIEGARGARVELADFYDTPVHPLRGDALREVGYEPGSCPNAEWFSERVISLPTGPQVDGSQIDRAVRYFNG